MQKRGTAVVVLGLLMAAVPVTADPNETYVVVCIATEEAYFDVPD